MIPDINITNLLIAPPAIPDPRFKNTVLMVTHKNRSGTFALCANKPTGFGLDEILEDSNLKVPHPPAIPVFWGGPVSSNSLWMLHSSDWITESSVSISSEWAMTSSEEMFHNLTDGDTPKYFRILMGYCAWSPNQLEGELGGSAPWKKEHSWLVASNLGPEWLLDQDHEDLWASATTLCSHQAVDSWL